MGASKSQLGSGATGPPPNAATFMRSSHALTFLAFSSGVTKTNTPNVPLMIVAVTSMLRYRRRVVLQLRGHRTTGVALIGLQKAADRLTLSFPRVRFEY